MSGNQEAGVERRESAETDVTVYLQRRTCDAFNATLRTFCQLQKEIVATSGGGVSLCTLRQVEQAVVTLDRELTSDLHRANLEALADSDVAELRWMSLRDLEEVAALERQSFTSGDMPHELDHLRNSLYDPDLLAIIAEVGGQMAAVAQIGLFRGEVVLINVVVRAEFRRRGIGRQLVRRALAKLNRRRQFVLATVHEQNLVAQKFLQACGFVCRGTHPDVQTPAESGDAYLFEYRRPSVAADPQTRGDA